MNTTSRLLGRLIILALALCLTTACREKNDDDGPVTPTTPTGNKFTIAATGGTVETGDIAIQIPAGTFDEAGDLYIDKASSQELVGDVAYSDFHKVTLPKNMGKEVTISIKSEYNENAHMVVSVDGWNRHSNQDVTIVTPLPTTYANGAYTAKLPQMQGEDGAQPTLTVGLVDSPQDIGEETSETRASTSSKRFTIDWYYHWSLAERQIVNLTRQYAEEAVNIIEKVGFRLPEGVKIPMVITKGVEGWGACNISGWGKAFYEVRLNEAMFRNIATANQDQLWQLKQTLVHEMLHYYTSYAYDPRWAITIASRGSKGDPWTLLEEASGSWIEKYTGDRRLGENCPANAMEFMQNFIPAQLDCTTSINHGYGMALALEYLAKRHGDESILKLFELKRDGKAGNLRECFDLYLDAYEDSLFTYAAYEAFTDEVMNYKIDERVGVSELAEVPPVRVVDGSVITANGKAKKFGILINGVYIPANTNVGGTSIPTGDLSGREMSIHQQNANLVTDIYVVDQDNPGGSKIGTSENGRATYLSGNLNDYKGNAGKLYVVTRSKTNTVEEENSTIVFEITDPAPALGLSPTPITFAPDGEEKEVNISTNCSQLSIVSKPSWCSAQISGNTLKLKAEANTENDKRDGQVVVRARNKRGSVEATIEVEQEKKVKYDYAAGIVKVTLSQYNELTIPSLGGRAAAGTSAVNEDGSFSFTSSGTDSTEPKYLDIPDMGWTVTMITKSTWHINIYAVNQDGRIIIQSGSASQTFVSQSIVHNTATGDYVKTQTSTSEMSFSFSNIAEPAVLTTGFNDTCSDWFSYDAWRAKAATLDEFGQYVHDFKWVEKTSDGREIEKPLSYFGGKNLVITVGLWEDDHVNIPAGRTQ